MLIHKIPYYKLYDILLEKYRIRELFTDEFISKPPSSNANWEIERPVEYKNKRNGNVETKSVKIIFQVFKKIGDATIFSRIKYDLNKNPTREVDDDLFIEVFNYIGINLPPELQDGNAFDPSYFVRILYQCFIEQYCSDFFANREDELIVYGEKIKYIKRNGKPSINPSTSATAIDEHFKTNSPGIFEHSGVVGTDEPLTYNMEQADRTVEELDEVIDDFFNYIDEKKYVDAYDLLTDRHKAQFNNNVINFINHFIRTISISDIYTFNYRLYDDFNTAFVNVFYREERKKYIAPEFHDTECFNLYHLDKIGQKTNSFLKRLEKAGIKGASPHNFRALEFLNTDLADFLIRNTNMHISNIEDLLTYKGDETEYRLCSMWLNKENNNWRISIIGNLPTTKFYNVDSSKIKRF